MDIKNISIDENEITVFRTNGDPDYFVRQSADDQTWNHKSSNGEETVLSNAEVSELLATAVSSCAKGITFSSTVPQQPAEAQEQPAHHSGQYV